MVTRLLKRLPTIYQTWRPGDQCGSKPVISDSWAMRKVPPDLGCWAAARPTRPTTMSRTISVNHVMCRFMACPPFIPLWPSPHICSHTFSTGNLYAVPILIPVMAPHAGTGSAVRHTYPPLHFALWLRRQNGLYRQVVWLCLELLVQRLRVVRAVY